jgi:hypothetical protein
MRMELIIMDIGRIFIPDLTCFKTSCRECVNILFISLRRYVHPVTLGYYMYLDNNEFTIQTRCPLFIW